MTLRFPGFQSTYETAIVFDSGLTFVQTINEDFVRHLGTGISSTYTFADLRTFGSGVNAGGVGQTVAVDGHPGIFPLGTGTTAAGIAGVLTQLETYVFGTCRHRLQVVFRIPTLSTAGETFTVRAGFIDSDVGEAVDGVFLRYTHGTNGGRFQLVTRANNVETATNTGVAAVANTWYRLTIDVNAAGNLVSWDVNGTAGTVATNIPTGVARATGAGAAIYKSLGTTERKIELDLFRHWQDFAVTR